MRKSILRLPQVKTLTGLSRSSIYNYIANGSFPRQIALGPRCVGWVEDEIDEWICSRLESRDARYGPDSVSTSEEEIR